MTQTSTLSDVALGRAPAAGTGPSREPVRVMHVLFALQPAGMEFGVVKLVNGLDPARVRSSICSTRPAGDMKRFVDSHVPVFELRRRDGNDARLVWELFKLFRRERPHVVHTHAWGTLVEGLVAARLARVPYIVHGEHGTLQLRWYQTRIQRLMWGQATRVLSVSRKLSERMAAATGFPVSRIHTIQNGVDFGRFSPDLRGQGRTAVGLSDDAFVIGTAGRLVEVKDHANLIDALAIVQNRGVEFTAVIAGDGPLFESLQARIAERGLQSRVRLLGHQAQIERLYAGLDVFVLPSRSEGLSNTILEGMASGLPVVATRVGGAEELVEEGRTGLLVPSQDAGALADALIRLAADPVRARAMGTAGRLKAEREFSIARMLRDYEALYLDLVNSRRSSAYA